MPHDEAPAAVIGGIMKAINSSASRSRAADYCEGKAVYIAGINCRAGYWQDEASVTDAFFHKSGEGRLYYHYVYSLPPGHGTPEQLAEMVTRGIEANPVFHGHEIELAIHDDKAHLHCHILVNATSAADGRKLRFSHKQYRVWLMQMKAIARKYGYSPVISKVRQKGDLVTNNKLKREVVVREDRDADIVKVYQAMYEARRKAGSWEEYEGLLKADGILVERSPKRIHVVYSFNGRRFRDSNIGRTFTDDFTKEALNAEFQSRQRRQEIERDVERRERESELRKCGYGGIDNSGVLPGVRREERTRGRT